MAICEEADGFRWRYGLPSEMKKKPRRLSVEESEDLKKAKELTARLLLEIKKTYRIMCQENQAGRLKQNDRIMAKLLASSMTCTSVGESFTSIHRGLNLPAPSRSISILLCEIKAQVSATIGDSAWLGMVQSSYAELMAMAQLLEEQSFPEECL